MRKRPSQRGKRVDRGEALIVLPVPPEFEILTTEGEVRIRVAAITYIVLRRLYGASFLVRRVDQ